MNEIIIAIHGFSGCLVAVLGLVQILLRKGGRIHRILGRIYALAWLMLVISGSMIGYLLITLIGILGMYMVYTGYRFGAKKTIDLSVFDRAMIILANGIALATLTWGIYHLTQRHYNIGVIGSFFGFIFFMSSFQDYREFIQKKATKKTSGHRLQWLFEHYGRMYVSYIAAMTAFSALQNVFGIEIINWLAPTFIGGALVAWSNRYYYKLHKVK
ncbi:MAG: hypothetical protein AB8G15_06550 [Saprospiraceae bacterium]